MTVLIVDGHPVTCKLIRKLLTSIGYGKNILFADNGRQALDILQKEHVDLVLLDNGMPEMSGAETLSHIRDNRNLRDLPVIMVTAQALQDYVAEVGEAEIDAYILKPIRINVLEKKIATVIENANNPPPMVYHLKKARNFEEEGDISSAIEEAKMAREANPDATRPVRALGYYYFKMNNFKESEKYLLKAIKLNELDVFAFNYLGELYLKLNNIEKAAHYLAKAMEISPRHLRRGINFGKTLIQMKLIPKAVDVFEKVFKLAGNSFELQTEVADFCIEKGEDKYAAKLLESIVREHEDRADLLFKLAKTLERLGDVNRALLFLVNAGSIDKGNMEIKLHMAKDYLELGKPMMAEKPLKDILKIYPDHEEAKRYLKRCI